MKTRIFSVLCENVAGVMMRVSRCFTRRQINMDSITVGIEPSGLARMIILFQADDKMASFMRKVLLRLEPIVEVQMLEPENSIAREICLFRTRKLKEEEMSETIRLIQSAGGKVLEVREGTLIGEIGGSHEEVEHLLSSLGPDLLKEVARSGQVYLSKNKGPDQASGGI
ncbi:MAG: acetolactate synthase small subunit [Candidatus Hadarchaeales archaeon]